MLLCNKNILCIGGMDPAGAAGVLADGRMVQSLGGHSSALITCHTAQGRRRHTASHSVPVALLRQQWRSLQLDMPLHGIKIGAIADLAQAQWLASVLASVTVPVVFDPVLNSSSGGALGQADAARHLMPLASLATPNQQEVQQLYGRDWRRLLPTATLITGSDTTTDKHTIRHQLITPQGQHSWHVSRRAGEYRGTGCLLATAATAYLVANYSLPAACDQALAQVDRWLAQAWRFADGVHLPKPPT